MLIMPWIPPEEGRSDVSIWYATYCVLGLGILAVSFDSSSEETALLADYWSLLTDFAPSQLCGLYYYVWIILLPRLGGYEIVEEIEELDGGARLRKLVRRYPRRAEAEDVPLLTPSDAPP